MAQLAIKGHATRGKEVIELLEMLGGENKSNLEGTVDSYCYYIDDSNKICSCSSVYVENVIVFTLEEFEEKFPYKVGDKVIAWINGYRSICNIQNMEWDSIPNEIKYKIQDYWHSTMNLQPHKELTMKKKSKLINIEPKLVGNECVHFPIPTDMKLEVKDGMCYIYRDCGELKEYLDNATPEQLEEDWKEIGKFSVVEPIADKYVKQCKEGVNLQELKRKLDEVLGKETTKSLIKWMNEENMKENVCEESISNINDDAIFCFNYSMRPEVNADGMICYKIPEGYETFSVQDGMIILKPKQPTYPKNYDECCNILGIDDRENGYCGYEYELLGNFQQLYLCRNAYWKVAGEQMGLDKPWEPDWKDNYQKKWTICFYQGEINLTNGPNVHRILAFPTAEMRDAFFENFKELIELCKELL